MELIKRVVQYRTTDDQLFPTQVDAERHQRDIAQAKIATGRLDQGWTIAAILREANYPGEIDPVLENVTQDTELTISYWQCCDVPAYSPSCFRAGMLIYVGSSGSKWRNPYGQYLTVGDVVELANEDNRRRNKALGEVE